MGHSQSDKQATHHRIVQVAARRFRERGIDGISVGDIMKEAGLTVGGFYKHFESRDALVTEAFILALQDIEHIQDALKTEPQRAISTYMSTSHRNNVGRGCPISALANDVARAPMQPAKYSPNVSVKSSICSRSRFPRRKTPRIKRR